MLPNEPTVGDAPGDDEELAETEDTVETETEEEAEEEETEDEPEAETEETENETDEDGKAKKPSKNARRTARLRERIATLEEIARHESKRADEAVAARTALTSDLGPPPKREDYPDDIEYGAALAGYRAEERVLARTKKTAETTVTQTAETARTSKLDLFHQRTLALVERYPDIEKVVFAAPSAGGPPISEGMAAVIQDSDRGPEIAYYLGTHREEAGRIYSMTPLLAAKELGRIEALLSTPKPKTQTNAPKPVPKVSGGSARAAKDPDKMSIEEWTDWRNAQLGLVPGRRKGA